MVNKAIADENQIIEIPLSKIKVSDLNVRKKIDTQSIYELAASIKALGLIHQVEVMKRPREDKFDLIVGQRRYLAHKKLGKKTIRAVIIKRLDDNDSLIRSLVENVQRVEINPADAARATTALYKRYKKDVKKVSNVTGLSPQRIRQYVEIEEQSSAKTKRKLRERKVQPADVQRVLRAAQGNIEKADEMLDMMNKYQLDKYQKGRLVEYGEDHPKWSAKKIIEEAIKPRVEKSVVVPLSPKLRDGLQKAVDACRKTPDEITAEALEHWLKVNMYL
jgi:ParB family chromosome partitioning protein